ncbi:hypothetical protein, partial [Erythrobacter sp. HI0063]|uniref:hypothetical protein n=1 Tax=Erythrobacter sp. HI0063 TaxID=1822240 RepID=UPI000A4DF851
ALPPLDVFCVFVVVCPLSEDDCSPVAVPEPLVAVGSEEGAGAGVGTGLGLGARPIFESKVIVRLSGWGGVMRPLWTALPAGFLIETG